MLFSSCSMVNRLYWGEVRISKMELCFMLGYSEWLRAISASWAVSSYRICLIKDHWNICVCKKGELGVHVAKYQNRY